MKNNVVVKIFWLHYCCNHLPPESRGMNKTNGHYHLYPPCWPTDNRFSIKWVMGCVCHLLWQRNLYVLCLSSTLTKKSWIPNSNSLLKYVHHRGRSQAGSLGHGPYFANFAKRSYHCWVNMVTSSSKRKQSVWLLICHFGSFRISVWLLLVKNIWQPWIWHCRIIDMGIRINFSSGEATPTFCLSFLGWIFTKRFTFSTPQRKCPTFRWQSQKMCFIGISSQVYYNNWHIRLSANFQRRVLLFKHCYDL